MADTTETNIPFNISLTLKLYKKATSMVVNWLIENGTDEQNVMPQSKTRRRSSREIIVHADRVAKQGLAVPSYIQSAFEIALKNRRRMTTWHRTQELGNESLDTQQHEYFTETLSKAFRTICPDGTESVQTCHNSAEANPRQEVPAKEASLTSADEPEQNGDPLTENDTSSQSPTADDPSDAESLWESCLLEVDFIIVTVREYGRLADKGGMSISAFEQVALIGSRGIAALCEQYGGSMRLTYKELFTKMDSYFDDVCEMRVQALESMWEDDDLEDALKDAFSWMSI